MLFFYWFRMKEKFDQIERFRLFLFCVFFFTVLALLLTVIMSVLFLMTGMYGELENIGVAILISIQVYYYIHHIELNWLQIDKF